MLDRFSRHLREYKIINTKYICKGSTQTCWTSITVKLKEQTAFPKSRVISRYLQVIRARRGSDLHVFTTLPRPFAARIIPCV